MSSFNDSRRAFLRRAGALPAWGALASPVVLNLAALAAAQAQSSDYRALVCVFLFGGNDACNTVLPTDASSWTAYAAARRPETVGLHPPGTPVLASAPAGSADRLGGVLPLTPVTAPDGRSLALHPGLVRMRQLFDAERRLAILGNVGPLLMPTSKSEYGQASHPRPPKLFSHNDQQSCWQSGEPEGAAAGWGGHMADLLADLNGMAASFTGISTAGNAVWLTGQRVLQYQVGPDGALRMASDAAGRIYGRPSIAQALERIVSTPRSAHLLEQDVAAVAQRSIQAERQLSGVMPAARLLPYGTPGSAGADPLLQYANVDGVSALNALAQQLQVVARMMTACRVLGVRRQVFFVSLGGFDTHANQNRKHADLMLALDHGLGYFDTVLGALGLRDSVTTFTASEFGRSFTSNGDGTDHGWGGHHFVMGGAVRGGRLYGNLPVYGLAGSGGGFDSPHQVGVNGALLPQVSVDQYGATLARWFGVGDTALMPLFPNLANFDAAQRDLGFMVSA